MYTNINTDHTLEVIATFLESHPPLRLFATLEIILS
jgi:hypothetical protein